MKLAFLMSLCASIAVPLFLQVLPNSLLDIDTALPALPAGKRVLKLILATRLSGLILQAHLKSFAAYKFCLVYLSDYF
jgi:hypothetical protein